MRPECPHCGHRIDRPGACGPAHRCAFSRHRMHCPECDESLVWAERPWRLYYFGTGIFFAGALVLFGWMGATVWVYGAAGLGMKPPWSIPLATLVNIALGGALVIRGVVTLRPVAAPRISAA